MSRSITYRVVYNNNKKRIIAGLHTPVNAELFTSHFNQVEEGRMGMAILKFLNQKKKTKQHEFVLTASTGSSDDVWLHEVIVAEKDYVFRTFVEAFDKVNAWKG